MNNGIAGDDIIVDRLWQQQKLRTFESRHMSQVRFSRGAGRNGIRLTRLSTQSACVLHTGKGGAAHKRPRGYARSDPDRRLIYRPRPRAVDLLPFALETNNRAKSWGSRAKSRLIGFMAYNPPLAVGFGSSGRGSGIEGRAGLTAGRSELGPGAGGRTLLRRAILAGRGPVLGVLSEFPHDTVTL
jgi:hypothetical protein